MMVEDKIVKGPYYIDVSTPSGEKMHSQFTDVSTFAIATGTTANLGIYVNQNQYNALVDRLNTLENLAVSQESGETIITDSIGAEFKIPGIAKFFVKREITKKIK